MTTVREATIGLLRQLKLTTIFGNPGSTELPMFKDFPSDFTYILGLQEASAVGMAEGFAQATRHAALVNLHTAPGVGNAMGNIIAAHHHKTPLIVTAGQQVRPMQLIEAFLFSRDATDLPKPYVKWSYEPSRAQDVPAALARAYFTAMAAPRGPVFVSIPMDDWDVEIPPYQLDHEVTFKSAPEPQALRDLAASLKNARNPVLVVGPEVDREGAWESTRALAESLSMEVFSSPLSGRCSFPESHALFRGPLPAAQAPLAQRLNEFDFILVLGAPIFTYYPYVPGPILPPGACLVQITSDPDEAARAPVGKSIVGSVALAVQGLLAEIGELPRKTFEKRKEPPAPPNPEGGPLSPEFVFHTLSSFFSTDDILVEEAPSTRPIMQKQIRINSSGGYYTTGGGGLGYSLPAAVGIQLADRKRRVVCILGDGSSLYSVQALWTAAQHQLPVIFVIIDNAQYTILKSFSEFVGSGEVPGLELPGLDIAEIARGFGCPAERIETSKELFSALPRAREMRGPILLNVKVTRDVPPLLGS
jgi:benzoylformate decarboxylase